MIPVIYSVSHSVATMGLLSITNMSAHFLTISILLQLVLPEEYVGKVKAQVIEYSNQGNTNSGMIPMQGKVTPLVQIPCICSFPSCTCCANFNAIGGGDLQLGCVITDFLPDNFGIRVRVKIGNEVKYDQEVSAVNPPPICVPVPNVPLVQFCGQLYDVRLGGSFNQFCLKASLQVANNDVASVNFDCVKVLLGS